MVDLKEQWVNKQKNVEEKFLELEEESKVQRPLPKKQKRGKKTEPQEQLSDPFATYAAEIQIEMFTKVKLRILCNSYYAHVRDVRSCTLKNLLEEY